MEELLAALKNYFELLDNTDEDRNELAYIKLITDAEEDLRSFLPKEEYELPAFLTKGITK